MQVRYQDQRYLQGLPQASLDAQSVTLQVQENHFHPHFLWYLVLVHPPEEHAECQPEPKVDHFHVWSWLQGSYYEYPGGIPPGVPVFTPLVRPNRFIIRITTLHV